MLAVASTFTELVSKLN